VAPSPAAPAAALLYRLPPTCAHLPWPGSPRPEETAWYHSLVPGAVLVVFEHSSHLPHLEEPEAYLQALRGFVHDTERTP
jgi:pimeloyl-ACP methyl ester carboxylesterase